MMESTTKRRLAWGALAVVVLALLWVLLHLWPTSEDSARAATSEQRQALHRAYVYWNTGHPKEARRALRKAYRSNADIPTYARRNPWSVTWPANRGRGRCTTTGWKVTVSAQVINVPLFEAYYALRFCFDGHRVTDVSRYHAAQKVRAFGEFLNWSMQGIVGAAHGWCQNHVCYAAAKGVRFHNCTPTPLGCAFGHDHDIVGVTTAFGDGTDTFDG